MLFGALITLSISLAPVDGWSWRLLATAATIALAWSPVRAILLQKGRGAVRRFEWTADGRWNICDADRVQHETRLAPQTAAFGPWVLLVWYPRRYALIDSAYVSPTAFRALRGRLSLTSRQWNVRESDDN